MLDEANYRKYTCLNVDIYTIADNVFDSMLEFLAVVDEEKSWYFVETNTRRAEIYFEHPEDANAFRLKFEI